MSLVAVAAAKAAPGVTTSALAMAGVWPADRQVLLVEADQGGGDLAARFGLAAQPGLVSLAAAARRQVDTALVGEHAQTLPGGLGVLVGPPGAEQATAALGMLAAVVLAGLDGLDGVDIIADLGRLDPASPALGLAQAAVVLVGTGPYPAEEIAAALGIEVVGALPADPRAALLLGGSAASASALRRTPLIRAARSLTEAILGRLAGSATAAPAPAGVAAPAAPAPRRFPTSPPPRSEPAREVQP